MKIILLRIVLSAFLFTPVAGFASDFYEQFLTAGFPSANPAASKVVVGSQGPGVQHADGSIEDVVVYCPVHVDSSNFFNGFQLVADDNTPDGYVQATFWRMSILTAQAKPEQLASVKTVDNANGQIRKNYRSLYGSLDDSQYVYWIEVRLVRTNPAATVTAYSTGLLDVF